MELIPIIYTVLKIVVVLTIITLTVSYVGYRLRQRKSLNVVNNSENEKFLQPIVKISAPSNSEIKSGDSRPYQKKNDVKSVPKQNGSQQILKPAEPRRVSSPDELRRESKPNEKKEEKPNRDRRKEDSPKRPAHKDSSKHDEEKRIERPRVLNERISVLKNLSAQHTKETLPPLPKAKKKTTKDQTQALGDDILDKYIEDEDHDMFTLKVKKNKENLEDDD